MHESAHTRDTLERVAPTRECTLWDHARSRGNEKGWQTRGGLQIRAHVYARARICVCLRVVVSRCLLVKAGRGAGSSSSNTVIVVAVGVVVVAMRWWCGPGSIQGPRHHPPALNDSTRPFHPPRPRGEQTPSQTLSPPVLSLFLSLSRPSLPRPRSPYGASLYQPEQIKLAYGA